MANASLSGLAKVQSLYTLQFELYKVLDGQISKDDKKEALECAKKFSRLLKEVDWRYMGGEDVYDELLTMHKEVIDRLKKLPTSSVKKKTAAKPVKKSVTRKKTVRPKSKRSSNTASSKKKVAPKRKTSRPKSKKKRS